MMFVFGIFGIVVLSLLILSPSSRTAQLPPAPKFRNAHEAQTFEITSRIMAGMDVHVVGVDECVRSLRRAERIWQERHNDAEMYGFRAGILERLEEDYQNSGDPLLRQLMVAYRASFLPSDDDEGHLDA